jgi:hypothetical protein
VSVLGGNSFKQFDSCVAVGRPIYLSARTESSQASGLKARFHCTNTARIRAHFLAKNCKNSQVWLRGKKSGNLSLVFEKIEDFLEKNGDSGGARTPDLMLRRHRSMSKNLEKIALFSKNTRILPVNQLNCGPLINDRRNIGSSISSR